jgi:hypothetical protein
LKQELSTGLAAEYLNRRVLSEPAIGDNMTLRKKNPIQLSKDLHKEIKITAAKMDCTMAEIVQTAFHFWQKSLIKGDFDAKEKR